MANNSILNKVFSQNTMKEVTKTGKSEVLDTAFYDFFETEQKNVKNKDKFHQLYSVLKKEYRNEYFYKNTIINKLLLGRHSINTTTALSEVPLNKSKADIVLINGKAVVYEIKTELDSLERLDNQILDYYKVFDYVEVITEISHFEKVFQKYKDTPVGISVLTKKNTISQKKKPIKNSCLLEHRCIYKVLRKEERKNIISYFYDEIPVFDQFSEYEEMFKLFNQVEIADIYHQFLQELKKRSRVKNFSEEFYSIPYELKALAYFSSFKKNECQNFTTMLEED